jgi:formamidopyrimidine-DNA glycosylase
MPELPEVETIRHGIAARIGIRIASVEVRRADIIAGLPESTTESHHALLAGNTIRSLLRRGKQLAIESASGRIVLVQLGMSGQLCTQTAGAPLSSHTHVVWTFEDGKRMTFRDPRRFGGITLLESREALEAHWSSLGPDALEIGHEALAQTCRHTRRTVKAVLLDQRVLAGVGNIYADESLFLAGVRPRRSAHKLTHAELERLAAAIRSVLDEAVKARGSTLRDYVNAEGEPGQAQANHRVYGRAGEPCLKCGTTLRKVLVAQRTTVFCPGCQR